MDDKKVLNPISDDVMQSQTTGPSEVTPSKLLDGARSSSVSVDDRNKYSQPLALLPGMLPIPTGTAKIMVQKSTTDILFTERRCPSSCVCGAGGHRTLVKGKAMLWWEVGRSGRLTEATSALYLRTILESGGAVAAAYSFAPSGQLTTTSIIVAALIPVLIELLLWLLVCPARLYVAATRTYPEDVPVAAEAPSSRIHELNAGVKEIVRLALDPKDTGGPRPQYTKGEWRGTKCGGCQLTKLSVDESVVEYSMECCPSCKSAPCCQAFTSGAHGSKVAWVRSGFSGRSCSVLMLYEVILAPLIAVGVYFASSHSVEGTVITYVLLALLLGMMWWLSGKSQIAYAVKPDYRVEMIVKPEEEADVRMTILHAAASAVNYRGSIEEFKNEQVLVERTSEHCCSSDRTNMKVFPSRVQFRREPMCCCCCCHQPTSETCVKCCYGSSQFDILLDRVNSFSTRDSPTVSRAMLGIWSGVLSLLLVIGGASADNDMQIGISLGVAAFLIYYVGMPMWTRRTQEIIFAVDECETSIDFPAGEATITRECRWFCNQDKMSDTKKDVEEIMAVLHRAHQKATSGAALPPKY